MSLIFRVVDVPRCAQPISLEPLFYELYLELVDLHLDDSQAH